MPPKSLFADSMLPPMLFAPPVQEADFAPAAASESAAALHTLSSPAWLRDLRGKYMAEDQKMADLGPNYGSPLYPFEDACLARRERSRSRGRASSQRRGGAGNSPSVSPVRSKTGAGSKSEEPLEVEKLLQGGLARAFSRAAPRPVAAVPQRPQQPFSLFPRHPRPEARSERLRSQRKAAMAARQTEVAVLQQLIEEEKAAERMRAATHRASSADATASFTSASARVEQLLSQASATAVAPSPAASSSAEQPLLGLPRFYPSEFSTRELNKFADDEARKSFAFTLSAQDAFLFSRDRNAVTRRAMHVLETVDTPSESDQDADDAADLDLLFIAGQLDYRSVYGDTSATAAAAAGGTTAGADRGVSATSGRNVVSVKLQAARQTEDLVTTAPGHEGNNSPRHDATSIDPVLAAVAARVQSEKDVEDDDDDIGARLLQAFHNFHAFDGGVSEARRTYDRRMIELIFAAPSAAEARRLVLVEKAHEKL